MPDKIEPQLDELRRRARRRLIGAVVLALAAAVLVPMLLESDPKPLGEDVSVKIPPVDEGKFVSKLGEKAKPVEPPAAGKAAPPSAPRSPDASTVASAKDAGASTPKPVAEPPAIKPPPPKETPPQAVLPPPAPPSTPAKPAPENAPAPSSDAAKAPGGAFSVQLAAFADDKGANALVNRLKKAGHPAYTEPYTTSRGTLWRVRVGPYPTREAAENARTKLKADGQNGIIAAAS